MSQAATWFVFLALFNGMAVPLSFGASLVSQQSLTPLQAEIKKQHERLSSPEPEERRDAVMRLGALHHPAASRAAIPALRDSLPLIRATAAAAILALPAEESVAVLLPLLADRDEFVRRETAYALGKTESRTSVPALVNLLVRDRQDGVRGAAAVALGKLDDEAAVVPLAQILIPARGSRRTTNPFVLMAAARSLGQIGSRAGVPVLIATLDNGSVDDEVRREAAKALGAIGDPAAEPALRKALAASDPYLARIVQEALSNLSP